MTDPQGADMDNSEQANEVQIRPDQDWLLEKLVYLLNTGETDSSFGVMLNVGGAIVSGNMIGGREYFTKFGQSMATGMSKNTRQNVEDFFGKERDWYGPESELGDGPSFVHLRDARFYTAGQQPIPGNQGLLWRARLTEVAAFSMGVLVISED